MDDFEMPDTVEAAAQAMGDDFELPDHVDDGPTRPVDPMRPDVVNGRYKLPAPSTGKARSWQRTTNFIKLAEDTYNLDRWKERHIVRGLTMDPSLVKRATGKDVKDDKNTLNRIVEDAVDASEMHAMADEGTALHTSCETAEKAHGDLSAVIARHRPKVQLYMDALAVHGLEYVPELIERVVVSERYEVAGKFDNIFRMRDGDYVLGDLKTGSSLDLSMPSIAGQMAAYEDGINMHGIWDGSGYNTDIRVCTDFAVVVHLPSDRHEATLYKVDLEAGHELLAVCLRVRNQRKVKAKHVAEVYTVDSVMAGAGYWAGLLDAAHTTAAMMDVMERAKMFGQWTEDLADRARSRASQMAAVENGMGS